MDILSFLRIFLQQFYRIFFCSGILLLLHAVIRLIFWIGNHHSFGPFSWSQGSAIFLRGAQQDLVILALLNGPVLFLAALSSWFRPGKGLFIRVIRWLFIGANAAGMALNILDIGYFPFGRRRSNLDLIYVFSDSIGSFKSSLLEFWFLPLLFAGVVFILVRLARRWIGPVRYAAGERGSLAYSQGIFLVLFLAATLSFKNHPVIPSTPLLSVDSDNLPIAQNSALTFIYSCFRRETELIPENYFSEAALDQLVLSNHPMGKEGDHFQKKNIVICIMESFSRCYVEPGNPMKAYTPFFDSLIGKSIFFPDTYANGYTSNQGIVSILGGLPALLDEPFYYSSYANTPLRSIGNILREKGYNTNFFMGAGKDHFGFGKFARMAGIDHSYWQPDFGDDRLYDGNWGIFDEPFLQFGARVLAQKQEPFLATFFNISSHVPYTIPEKYRDRFGFPDKTPAQRSISYVDYSFRQFFNTCKQAPWFRNTLFVFCADHWLDPGSDKYPHNYVSVFAIPMIIYDPSADSGRVIREVAGQVDLAPTMLGLLHYRGDYSGFGRDLLDTGSGSRYVVNRYWDNYQIITGDLVLGYNLHRQKSQYLYRHSGERLLGKNLVEEPAFSGERATMERLIRANIQRYNQSLIRRSLK